jgi:hypothetical protein
MKYHSESWTLVDLLSIYNKGELNLNPSYQRNDIWSNLTKKKLIDSIKREYPLPVFFLHSKGNNKFDVVDGQQRIRAIMGYMKELFKDLDSKLYREIDTSAFNNYKIAVTIIDSSADETTLSDFYFRVNKYGTKLNRPEILRAQYKNTKFQELVSNLTDLDEFRDLNLFTPNNLNRLTDLDFVSELLGLIEFGVQEKKKSPDELFKIDVSLEKAEFLYSTFFEILDIVKEFNNIYPISKTRYKQKNDFYTLWGFLKENIEINKEVLNYFYKILVLIGQDITPSNEESTSMATYAYYCVTQSNSRKARLNRLDFLNKLFLNKESTINDTQLDILKYYSLNQNDVTNIGGYLIVDGKKIQDVVKLPLLFTGDQ